MMNWEEWTQSYGHKVMDTKLWTLSYVHYYILNAFVSMFNIVLSLPVLVPLTH